jgi:DNA-binding IclR family transcriptional regulator
MPNNAEPHGGTIQSDATLFAILESIYELEEAGVTQIADEVNVSPSTVHKHLKTLEQHQFVSNNGGSYQFGLKFLKYGGMVRDRNKLYQMVRPKIPELAEKTDKLVTFAMKDGNYGVFLYSYNDKYGIFKRLPLGTRFYLHQNSGGKSMLAALSDEAIDDYIEETGLPAVTDATIDTREELLEELATIREQGYAINAGERVRDIQAIGAAVYDKESATLGTITISEPAHRRSVEKIENELADELLEFVNEIELSIDIETRDNILSE